MRLNIFGRHGSDGYHLSFPSTSVPVDDGYSGEFPFQISFPMVDSIFAEHFSLAEPRMEIDLCFS